MELIDIGCHELLNVWKRSCYRINAAGIAVTKKEFCEKIVVLIIVIRVQIYLRIIPFPSQCLEWCKERVDNKEYRFGLEDFHYGFLSPHCINVFTIHCVIQIKICAEYRDMSRYSAQILICFIAYIFLFCLFLCGFGWELCRTAIMHSALCHCPL